MKPKNVSISARYLSHALRNIKSFSADGWQFVSQSKTMECEYLRFVHTNGSRMLLKYVGDEVSFIINGCVKKIEKL